MAGILLHFAYPIFLGLAPAAVGGADPGGLPAGDDPAFRARMMDWSGPAPEPVVPRAEAPVGGAAALPRLSSRFGVRGDPIRGGRAMHDGIDIPGAPGSPVRAADAGIVRFAGAAGGYGNLVEVAHAGGLSTRYAHLSHMLVRPGTRVARGDVIALMGSTGRSTGSHLHFEVRAYGRALDPLRVLGPARGQAPGAPPITPASAPHLSAFARARLAKEGLSSPDR